MMMRRATGQFLDTFTARMVRTRAAPLHTTLVTDDAGTRTSIGHMLRSLGYRVTPISVDEATPQTILHHFPACMVFDLQIDRLASSWPALLQVRLDARTRPIPMVVVVSEAVAAAPEYIHLARMTVSIQRRPFRIDDVRATIGTALIRV